MNLLDECIEALDNCYILNEDEKKQVENNFYSLVPLTNWGRIDWDKFDSKIEITQVEDILNLCNESNFYIIWSVNDPILKSNINDILNKIDDVTAVSFDTWLLSEDKKIIIEFYHEGEVTLGKLKN
ncbi:MULTISPECIES: CDI toxin immunity protein [Brevibacillus]|uniref:CDI toxin immunity protein n=1 Tax=Brevibacillus TaxID=55080 RepID=UPI000B9B0248|nr:MULTISPECIES: hypothetical protein [Brevibacillus]AYB38274.1 hypothetical protein D5F52_08365 [Brevibacillus laterosporus]MBG9789655.1 hypothetical protein [Brevibacillus laterosporus]MBM7111691.1 hypothetical protein [Brevibacillus laterosporus]MCG7318598.1 hypothetical protein [Brevibacillus laterosporus]MED1790971.1 hypothetical protein [Brevibacillus laterosporus]